MIKGPDDSLYMRRWFIIRTRNFGLFIHKFVRSDYDRALHDHPWNFIVVPIWRGYIEHGICDGCQKYPEYSQNQTCPDPQQKRIYPILGTRYRSATYRHRVELIQREISDQTMAICGPLETNLPSWSLFLRFRKRRHWGFWCPQGWRPWIEGKSDHCNETL